MTLLQLRTLTYALLTQSSGNSNWSDAQLDTYINIAYRTILRDFPCYLATKAITLPDSQTYDLDEILAVAGYSIVDIHSVLFRNSSDVTNTLQRIPFDDIANYNGSESNTQDRVVLFGFSNRATDALAVYPIPNAGTKTTLTIRQFLSPDTDILSADGDTPTADGLPIYFHELIAYQATYQALLTAGEMERAVPFYQTFLQPGLARLNDWAKETYPEPVQRFGKFARI